ncbi:hypothetical protein [Herbaspirillum sp. YR522]|uniref:hypothetical protein n=1 Tax=Herbaspirillum sp. YR522 TaxID=1144342 RepID=UPI00026FAAC7|nr:hypothetical protein [Herbaspirillum sp. YR522]EJN07891.1 hypothetical protein PMI40_01644 [Herbaspirillum sp. YR522]
MHPFPFPRSLRRALRAGVACALLMAALAAQATALVDLIASDILPMTAQLRKDLRLTPNQQTLWQQSDQKTRAVLNQRQQRRARLQQDTERVLRTPDAELRELARGYDDDGAASEQEARQLREIWFSMADALDDAQLKQVQDYILDRMQRVADGPGKSDGSHGGGRGARPSGGMGSGGAMGGMGGMGGAGGRGGNNGVGLDTGF